MIELDGAMIGTVELNRRDAERRSQVRPDAGEAELGYLLLPTAWGHGYAVEACAAALAWFTDARPGEPVVLCTQTANRHSHARRGLRAMCGHRFVAHSVKGEGAATRRR